MTDVGAGVDALRVLPTHVQRGRVSRGAASAAVRRAGRGRGIGAVNGVAAASDSRVAGGGGGGHVDAGVVERVAGTGMT